MNEEIKKEIKNIHWVDLGVDECDKKTIAKLLKHQEFILKILDKYKDKENIKEIDYWYKNTYGRISQHRASEIDILDKLNEVIKKLNGIEVK